MKTLKILGKYLSNIIIYKRPTSQLMIEYNMLNDKVKADKIILIRL